MQKGYQSLRFSDRNNCNEIDCILVAGYNRQASVTLAAPVPESEPQQFSEAFFFFVYKHHQDSEMHMPVTFTAICSKQPFDSREIFPPV